MTGEDERRATRAELLLAAGSRIPATRAAAEGARGRWDPALWLILGAFAAYELAAHFTGNTDARTLSNRVLAFEEWAGLPGRVAVGMGLLAAFAWLSVHWHVL